MTLGPIEVLVIGFPGNRFNGQIVPEITSLIERGIITVVDAVMIQKDESGDVSFIELEQTDVDDPAIGAFAGLIHGGTNDLVSDEDLDEFAADLDVNSSAAVLVFEHTWSKGFRDAVVASGGVVVRDLRIPGMVVEEVLAAVEALG